MTNYETDTDDQYQIRCPAVGINEIKPSQIIYSLESKFFKCFPN